MKAYEASLLPLESIDWAAHVSRIARAHAALARYDGMLRAVVNPRLLLAPLATEEAVLSSRIEGTQASVEEVLTFEATSEASEPSREEDIREILNYRRAMGEAVSELAQRPFSLNLLKRLHAVLLDSVRGRNKAPGLFRREEVHIGTPGEPRERASYLPPLWPRVEPAMENWEAYYHAEERDYLVQLAVLKAQLELIHPFLDGNGRMGRMLVPLFLYEREALYDPVFYLSAYLEAHRDEYITRLQAISRSGDWTGWIDFFLRAIEEQARTNTAKATQIIRLYDRMKVQVPQLTRSQYAIQAIDALFGAPIFRSASFVERAQIPKNSALRILSMLRQHGVVSEIMPARGSRPALLAFPELLAITA